MREVARVAVLAVAHLDEVLAQLRLAGLRLRLAGLPRPRLRRWPVRRRVPGGHLVSGRVRVRVRGSVRVTVSVSVSVRVRVSVTNRGREIYSTPVRVTVSVSVSVSDSVTLGVFLTIPADPSMNPV